MYLILFSGQTQKRNIEVIICSLTMKMKQYVTPFKLHWLETGWGLSCKTFNTNRWKISGTPRGQNTQRDQTRQWKIQHRLYSATVRPFIYVKKSYIPMSNRSTIAASWPSKDYLPTFKTLIGLGVGGSRYIPVRCWEKQCHWILQTYIHCYFVFVQHSCSKHILIMIVNSIIYIYIYTPY